jgi:phosphoinositide-3-kinase regulatory subunit 4
MGSSRFLKSIKARHRSGALVIKVFVKLDSHMDLRPTSKRIAGVYWFALAVRAVLILKLTMIYWLAERAALADCPNVLPYSQALATERAGYLIRQWLASNLYDRIR